MPPHPVLQQRLQSCADMSPLWVFGYGSLVWKADFPHSDKKVGHICGFMRRFWQASTDHRGVPGAPGRVVTLLPSDQETTWGVAYKVEPEDAEEVMSYLNFREKNGYDKYKVPFYPLGEETSSMDVLVFVATPDNEHFLGAEPLCSMAQQIATSVGPSGANTEYLFRLADAMRELCPTVQDDHLFELERAVRSILAAPPS